jgi:hypothetical protein
LTGPAAGPYSVRIFGPVYDTAAFARLTQRFRRDFAVQANAAQREINRPFDIETVKLSAGRWMRKPFLKLFGGSYGLR